MSLIAPPLGEGVLLIDRRRLLVSGASLLAASHISSSRSLACGADAAPGAATVRLHALFDSFMDERLSRNPERALAQHRLGGKFDIRDFHDVGLTAAPMPLAVLDRVIDEWIRSRAA